MVKTRQRSRSSTTNILQNYGQCYTSSLEPLSGKTMIRCGFKDCNYTTDKNSNFKRHLETMHQRLQPPVTCCDISFVTKGEYRFHTRSVHQDGHHCSTCDKVFNRKALLERHTAIHTGTKPFSCNFCEYASANKANVIRHIATHGGGTLTKVPRSVANQSQSPSSSPNSAPCSTTTSTNSRLEPEVEASLPAPDSPTKSTTPKETPESHPTQLSHSIESILKNSDPETILPGDGEEANHGKINDRSELAPRTRTNCNWSQLSSENEGLGLQLQQQYTSWAQYYPHQLQLPFFVPSYNYVNYSQNWMNNGPPAQYYQQWYNQGYSGEERQQGGDLDLLPLEETRQIETVPDFLPRGLSLKKKSPSKSKGAKKAKVGNSALGQDLSKGPMPMPALFVNGNQNHAQINDDEDETEFYIPKKLRLSKKFEKSSSPQ